MRAWRGRPFPGLKHHQYLSIKPSKHHSALGGAARNGSYGVTLYLSRDWGQENWNTGRNEGAPEILRKMTSFHLLLWKFLTVLAGHCIHGNIVLSFCLKLHTCAHTNKPLLMHVGGRWGRWHRRGDTAASQGQGWPLSAMAQCFL